jgi:hypothetical protein
MADVTKFFDKEFEQKDFSDLVEAPIDAIAGLSKADADALKQAHDGYGERHLLRFQDKKKIKGEEYNYS